jgi:hypothetical protein
MRRRMCAFEMTISPTCLIEYLDAPSTDLALLKRPDEFLAEMEAAYQRLIELSLELAAAILAERL